MAARALFRAAAPGAMASNANTASLQASKRSGAAAIRRALASVSPWKIEFARTSATQNSFGYSSLVTTWQVHAHGPSPQDLVGPGGWRRGVAAIVAVPITFLLS